MSNGNYDSVWEKHIDEKHCWIRKKRENDVTQQNMYSSYSAHGKEKAKLWKFMFIAFPFDTIPRHFQPYVLNLIWYAFYWRFPALPIHRYIHHFHTDNGSILYVINRMHIFTLTRISTQLDWCTFGIIYVQY